MLRTVPFRDNKPFYELNELSEDTSLVKLIRECVGLQKQSFEASGAKSFKPDPDSQRHVSPEALEVLKASQKDVQGIRTEREISNVIVFNDKRYPDGVFDKELMRARRQLDRLIVRRVRELFGRGISLNVVSSGFFLYPRFGYMGWHTNSNTPGWRLYINYAEETGRSFIRYRDPSDGRIVTCMDKEVNFRLFHVSLERPLWHCVYSETNRFSLGYRITEPSGWRGILRNRLAEWLRFLK